MLSAQTTDAKTAEALSDLKVRGLTVRNMLNTSENHIAELIQ